MQRVHSDRHSRIAGYGEKPLDRRVTVELVRIDVPSFDQQPTRCLSTEVAADGTLGLGSLQPGRHRVRLFVETEFDERRDAHEVGRMTVEIASGPRDWTLPLPLTSVVRVAVAAGTKGSFTLVPIGWVPADAEPDDRRRRFAEPDGDGIVSFKDVVPGTHEIRDPRRNLIVIEAPVREVIAFVEAAVNALRVVITDGEGMLASAGLRTGDWIVAIHGCEFASRDELEHIINSVPAGEMTLTVERSGERFEIVAARVLLQDSRASGGYLGDASR